MKKSKSLLITLIAVALMLLWNPVPVSANETKENLISENETIETTARENSSIDAATGTTTAILNCTTITEQQLYDAILPKVFRVLFSIILKHWHCFRAVPSVFVVKK